MLRKLTAAALIGAVALTTSLPASAYYPPVPPPPPAHTAGTSGAAGAGAVAGFIGFVAILAGYDLVRRTTCIGDRWRLGGPGFTEKMPTGNVMIPQCPVKRRAVVSARG
jgi:hypothetical protein